MKYPGIKLLTFLASLFGSFLISAHVQAAETVDVSFQGSISSSLNESSYLAELPAAPSVKFASSQGSKSKQNGTNKKQPMRNHHHRLPSGLPNAAQQGGQGNGQRGLQRANGQNPGAAVRQGRVAQPVGQRNGQRALQRRNGQNAGGGVRQGGVAQQGGQGNGQRALQRANGQNPGAAVRQGGVAQPAGQGNGQRALQRANGQNPGAAVRQGRVAQPAGQGNGQRGPQLGNGQNPGAAVGQGGVANGVALRRQMLPIPRGATTFSAPAPTGLDVNGNPVYAAAPVFRRAMLNTAGNAPQVYSGAVVRPFRIAGKRVETVQVAGGTPDQLFLNWSTRNFGEHLGGGANSSAFRDRNNRFMVTKVVKLNNNGDAGANEATITDQMAGEAMLKQVKLGIEAQGNSARPRHALFSVASSIIPKVVRVTGGPNVQPVTYAVFETSNIASPVYNRNGQTVKVFNQMGLNGQEVKVTNARERLAARARFGGSPRLTAKEELTINLVVRRLNNRGIVWADQKMDNLDVVKDPTSPTGHKVILFDYDALRPVRGSDMVSRRAKARDIQKKFDGLKRNERPSQKGVSMRDFDMTAFGQDAVNLTYMYSPGFNINRSAEHSPNNTLGYNDFNNMSDRQLRDAANTVLGANATTTGLIFSN